MEKLWQIKSGPTVDLLRPFDDNNNLWVRVHNTVNMAFEHVREQFGAKDSYNTRRAAALTYSLAMATTTDVVIKMRLYTYGTHKDIHHPKCRIVFKVDLSITSGSWVAPVGGFSNDYGKASVDRVLRAIVNLDANIIVYGDAHPQRGRKVPIRNIEQVLDTIRANLPWEE